MLNGDAIEKYVAGISAIDYVVGAGGVIAMRPLLLHASAKAIGAQPRRVLHFEYASTRLFEAGLELAF